MNSITLIPVTTGQIDGRNVQLADARRLHEFLGVRSDFSTWIKRRIQEYGFVEGEDFITFDSPNLGNQKKHGGNRRSIDYFVTLDMAKELAMVERTPRGRQARRYFIECERQLQCLQQVGAPAVKAHAVPLTRAERQAINRQAWADVAGQAAAKFHARREELLRQYRERPWPLPDGGPVQLPRGLRPKWAM